MGIQRFIFGINYNEQNEKPKPILTNKLLFLNKYYFLEVFEDMPDTDEVYKNSTTFVYITLIAFLR